MFNFNNIFLTFVLTAFLSTVTLADEVFDVNENLIGATAFTDYTGLVATSVY